MVVYLIIARKNSKKVRASAESDNKSILNILCSGEYFDEDIWSSGVSREIICPSIGCQSGPDKLIEETQIISGERMRTGRRLSLGNVDTSPP